MLTGVGAERHAYQMKHLRKTCLSDETFNKDMLIR